MIQCGLDVLHNCTLTVLMAFNYLGYVVSIFWVAFWNTFEQHTIYRASIKEWHSLSAHLLADFTKTEQLMAGCFPAPLCHFGLPLVPDPGHLIIEPTQYC